MRFTKLSPPLACACPLSRGAEDDELAALSPAAPTAGCGTWWATTLLGWWDSFYIIYPDCPGVELKGGCYNATRDGDYYLQKTDYANIAIQVSRNGHV